MTCLDIEGLESRFMLKLLISVNFLIIAYDPLTVISDAIHRRLVQRFRILKNHSKIGRPSLDSGRKTALHGGS